MRLLLATVSIACVGVSDPAPVAGPALDDAPADAAGDDADAPAIPQDDTAAPDTATPADPPRSAFGVDPPPATLHGCQLFPTDTVFHADVRALPVHPSSARWIAHLDGARANLPAKLDTSDPWTPVRYGVPFATATAATPRRKVVYDGLYPVANQFPGPFPLPPGLDVQTGFDQQTLVLETDACELYELIGYSDLLVPAANGGAWFDLAAHDPTPERWAVTASRLPILAIQVRADEITRGRIDHPLAFALPAPSSAPAIWPALSTDGPSPEPDALPMGTWVRLRADVDVAAMPPAVQVVARALQVHGAILADTGGPPGTFTFKLQKTDAWRDAAGADVSTELARIGAWITADQLEAIDPTPMQHAPTSWRVR